MMRVEDRQQSLKKNEVWRRKKNENKQKNKEGMAAAEISTCLSTFFYYLFLLHKKML
jgi:hypothetical protein